MFDNAIAYSVLYFAGYLSKKAQLFEGKLMHIGRIFVGRRQMRKYGSDTKFVLRIEKIYNLRYVFLFEACSVHSRIRLYMHRIVFYSEFFGKIAYQSQYPEIAYFRLKIIFKQLINSALHRIKYHYRHLHATLSQLHSFVYKGNTQIITTIVLHRQSYLDRAATVRRRLYHTHQFCLWTQLRTEISDIMKHSIKINL